MVKRLVKIFNTTIKSIKTSKAWKQSDMIHEKGDKIDKPQSNIRKLFGKITENRLENILDNQQPKEQAGFRNNFPHNRYLTTLNLLVKKSEEYNRKIYLAFIDQKPLIQEVEYEKIYEALKKKSVP